MCTKCTALHFPCFWKLSSIYYVHFTSKVCFTKDKLPICGNIFDYLFTFYMWLKHVSFLSINWYLLTNNTFLKYHSNWNNSDAIFTTFFCLSKILLFDSHFLYSISRPIWVSNVSTLYQLLYVHITFCQMKVKPFSI